MGLVVLGSDTGGSPAPDPAGPSRPLSGAVSPRAVGAKETLLGYLFRLRSRRPGRFAAPIEDRQVIAVMGRLLSSTRCLGFPGQDLVGLPQQAKDRRLVFGPGLEQGIFQDGQGA